MNMWRHKIFMKVYKNISKNAYKQRTIKPDLKFFYSI